MNIQPMQQSYISFGSMKKNRFSGIDYAVVEKFKAPIEKFNSNSDLQDWAEKKCDEIVASDFGGKDKETYFQRREEVRHWAKELNWDETKTGAEKLLILNGITKSLSPDDSTFVPVYNEAVLEESLNKIKSNLKSNPTLKFDFGEIYKKDLIRATLSENIRDINPVWVHIPSRKEDRGNFMNNVQRLKILSSSHWCIKNDHAKDFLRDCDFDIYLEDYKPKIAIKSEEGYVLELEDETNSRFIPKNYKKAVKNYIKEQNLVLTGIAKKILNKNSDS